MPFCEAWLEDGRMHHIAFALDPDEYWVEIIGQKPTEETKDVTDTDPSTYRMNHTMIRVKDKDVSIKFYEDVFGMKLMRTSENKDAGFTLYFLAYGPHPGEASANGVNPGAFKEGLLELTWNYGTENDADFKYHNGNDEPQGFGHICIAVDDLDAACKRFEDNKVCRKPILITIIANASQGKLEEASDRRTNEEHSIRAW